MSRLPTGTRNIRPCRVKLGALFLLLAVTAQVAAPGERQTGWHDPEFARFPFQQWLAAGHQSQIRWSVFVLPPELSTHQRMILRVTLRVDGKELEKRRGAGEFVALIEYRDGNGHVWQNHLSIDPAKLEAALQRQYLDIGFYAFVLPGDYTIGLAVCDPGTMQHSATLRKVHVIGPKSDPLPDSWSGLPPVETLPGGLEPPDIWYLPDVETRLRLPVESKRPLHIQILLNATPTETRAGSLSAMRDNMSVLIPALKTLSQMQLRSGAIDAALLDLTHRKVVFEQNRIHELDWDSMRKFFLETKPGIIDVHTLADRRKMLAFFAGEVSRRLVSRDEGEVPVVIVLSGPAFFEDQEAATPPREVAGSNRPLIYIRYRTVQMPRRYPAGAPRPAGYGRFPVTTLAPPNQEMLIPPMKEDDLEKTAEALNARLFDAASALQFRRILAALVEQLSAM